MESSVKASDVSTSAPVHVGEEILTPEEQNRGMFWLVAGNGLSTILVDTNFYGNFFMLFLAELSLDAGKIGSILSLLSLCGMLSLVLAPTVARVGYRRGWLFYAWFRLIFAGLLLAAPFVEHRWGTAAQTLCWWRCVWSDLDSRERWEIRRSLRGARR